jgi:hypothetical protein
VISCLKRQGNESVFSLSDSRVCVTGSGVELNAAGFGLATEVPVGESDRGIRDLSRGGVDPVVGVPWHGLLFVLREQQLVIP